ncbi:MAG: hypothetical protein ACREB9_07890 [Thermoplasmata archaeon]
MRVWVLTATAEKRRARFWRHGDNIIRFMYVVSVHDSEESAEERMRSLRTLTPDVAFWIQAYDVFTISGVSQ